MKSEWKARWWESWEEELIMQENWTLDELSAMLNRTKTAISAKRNDLRKR